MKLHAILPGLLCVMILLSGCSSSKPPTPEPTPPPSFTMEVNVDKPVYRTGETILIFVKASHECYLSLYDISTLGEVTQIFPNRFATDNLIQGGQQYQIPTESDRFDFEITGPPGLERVRSVCTRQNVNLFEQQTRSTDEVFPMLYAEPAPFEQSLNEELSAIPIEQWTEASVTFQVQ